MDGLRCPICTFLMSFGMSDSELGMHREPDGWCKMRGGKDSSTAFISFNLCT